MEERKELKVSAIENGTVIDHIPTQSVFQVISILKLDDCDNQILFGTNLESARIIESMDRNASESAPMRSRISSTVIVAAASSWRAAVSMP